MRSHRPRRPIATLLLAAIATSLLQPVLAADQDEPIQVYGAGASFPAPLYLRWFRDYYLAHPRARIDYNSMGSSAGVREMLDGRADFSGSDLPLSADEAKQVPGGVRQAPMAAGGIVLVYNLPKIEGLRLSRQALAGIFTGTVERWNDSAIVATNPDVDLPDSPIIVVARAAASGTSYKFSRHLSAISPLFAEEVGTSKTPTWPDRLKTRAGIVRARGNDGIAASVQAIPASIGYVNSTFAKLPGMQTAIIENRSGQFVLPDNRGFEAALASVIKDDSIGQVADPDVQDAYPILSLSWLILPENKKDSPQQKILDDAIEYALGPGQDITEQLGYVRFPASLIDYARQQLK